MRRALQLYAVSALLVGLTLLIVAGVKVYVTWIDGPEAKATSTPALSPDPEDDPTCSMAREGVEVPCTPENLAWAAKEQEKIEEQEPETCKARCQEAVRRKPQAANESCLYRHGKIRWCLTVPEGEEWYISQYEGREHRGRYYLHNHKDEVQGYLRPTSYGWRAMVSVCGLEGPNNCGWARGGKVVRTGQRNVLYVYDQGKGYTARGARRASTPDERAVEVAAYKLIYGDCKEPWSDTPCRNGVGQ
jgi:hypothetical protein